MQVRFERSGPEVTDYAVVLLAKIDGVVRTIRVFASAHGFNEMHRYARRAGKQTGMPFHSGSLGEGMRAALGDVKLGYSRMIEGWDR
jgi:hypothetical protein